MRIPTFLLAAALVAPLPAATTHVWVHETRSDFDRADLTGVSLRSDGLLTLAPAVKELHDPSLPILWAVTEDAQGNVYLGGGGSGTGKAKLVRVDAAGKATTVTELDGTEIHALATGPKGELYAATAPDGKVYRVQNGQATVYYDPRAKYIWALAVAPTGDLYVATGDQGEVHRVTPNGQGSVLFRTDDTHARSLAVDAKGNLYVGTEPGGLIIRVTPQGTGFVVHQAGKREITAMAVGPDGSVYAAGVGNRPTTPALPSVAVPSTTSSTSTSTTTTTQNMPQPQQQSTTTTARSTPGVGALVIGGSGVSGGSEVYRIAADGEPRTIWTDREEVVYALTLDRQGRPVLGTGNRGRIFRVEDNNRSTLLLNLTPTQVTQMITGRDGRLLAVTANIGKLFQIGPNNAASGTLESEAMDAQSFSQWGRLALDSTGAVAAEVRTGNQDRPQKFWSPWTPVPLTADGGRIPAPAARFVQYRLTLQDGATPATVSRVELNYLPKNGAPVVKAIEAADPNYKFPVPSALITAGPRTLSLASIGSPRRSPRLSPNSESSSATLTFDKGQQAIRWSADDPNDDALRFTVEIKGLNETTWKPLASNLTARYHTFDSTAFPDGEYHVRVTATDQPDNATGEAKEGSLVSPPFTIDNSAPAITGLTGTRTGTQATVQFRASDTQTPLDRAEVSINGGPWRLIHPTTQVTDSRTHDFNVKLEVPATGEVTIAVRAMDAHANEAAAKTVLR